MQLAQIVHPEPLQLVNPVDLVDQSLPGIVPCFSRLRELFLKPSSRPLESATSLANAWMSSSATSSPMEWIHFAGGGVRDASPGLGVDGDMRAAGPSGSPVSARRFNPSGPAVSSNESGPR